MINVYATITDINYLVRAWALFRSFEPWMADKLFVFYCVDDETVDVLRRLAPQRALIVPAAEFETTDLMTARDNRARNEYCWTCKPAVLTHAMKAVPDVAWAVYLDSDMLAFDDLDPPLAQADKAGAALALTPHRFATPELRALAPEVGYFNAGYAAFRAGEEGLFALNWWQTQCLRACPNVPRDGLFADQKYLDQLPDLFRTHVIDEAGMNAAPWNVEANAPPTLTQGQIRVGDDPLRLYHFQGLRILGRRWFDMHPGAERIDGILLRQIYGPYCQALARAYAEICRVIPGFAKGTKPFSPRQWLSQLSRFVKRRSNLWLAVDLSGR